MRMYFHDGLLIFISLKAFWTDG